MQANMLKRGIAGLLAVVLGVLLFVLFRPREKPAAVETAVDSERAPGSPAPPSSPPRPSRPPAFDETEALRRRVHELEGRLQEHSTRPPGAAADDKLSSDKPKPPPTPKECAHQLSAECPVFPSPRETLLERARCGTLALDVPAFLNMDEEELAEASAKLGAEDVSLLKLRQGFRAELTAELDGLYRELAGRRYKPIDDFELLQNRTHALAENTDEMRRQLAEERAGLRPSPPPTDLANRSASERYWRWWSGVGDRYEQRLAQALGAERARKQRAEGGGWSRRHMMVGTCPEDREDDTAAK
jgi:hypothetical protein